jgi:hypothetical protein
MNQFSNNNLEMFFEKKNKEEKKNTIDSIASYKGQSSHYPNHTKKWKIASNNSTRQHRGKNV